MTAFNWPDGRAFRPATVDWQDVDIDRSSGSQLSGSVQTVALPGLRRGLTLNFPQQHVRERRALEAFIRRLNGGEHRALVSIPQVEFRYGGPLGNWIASGVTAGAAAAQFAGALTLAGCFGRNILRRVQALDNAAWGKVNVSISPDVTVAPDGTSSADKLVQGSATQGYLYQAVTIVPSTLYTLSVHAKQGEYRYLQLSGDAISGRIGSQAFFDLQAGTVIGVSPGTAQIIAAGNGFYRCVVSGTSTASATGAQPFMRPSANGSTPAPGDGTSGIYLWGAQLEAGSLSDYAPYAQATPGDWLHVPTSTGNQLLQIVADGAANDAGQMTVEVQPMLRGSVANGAAVELASPAALFRLAKRPTFPREQGGWCGPFSVELMEAFS